MKNITRDVYLDKKSPLNFGSNSDPLWRRSPLSRVLVFIVLHCVCFSVLCYIVFRPFLLLWTFVV